jgi:hypothetical protein
VPLDYARDAPALSLPKGCPLLAACCQLFLGRCLLLAGHKFAAPCPLGAWRMAHSARTFALCSMPYALCAPTAARCLLFTEL